jgi:ATP-dependent DNA helicase RecQ
MRISGTDKFVSHKHDKSVGALYRFHSFGNSVFKTFGGLSGNHRQEYFRIGIGLKKYEGYGPVFFELIDRECTERRLSRDAAPINEDFVPSSSSIAAFDYFRSGDSVDVVAKKMVRAKSTVVNYLADYVRYHRISDPTPWVNPSIAKQVFENKQLAEEGKLKPLFEHFKGEISYDDIRITLACDG